MIHPVLGHRYLAMALAGSTVFFTLPAHAQTKEEKLTAPPALYTDMIACKALSDAAARLACYDEKVAALETAQTNNEVVIAGREEVLEARKGLFGLTLPRINLFGGDGDEGSDILQIEGKISKARSLRGGKWLLTLEDGAVWRQTAPPRSTSRKPKVGDSITIERAAMGSFLAKVNDGRGFKVQRVVN